MIQLLAIQNEIQTYLGLFETQEECQQFKTLLPNYQNDTFQLENDYETLDFNGHQIPLTQFMFEEGEIHLYDIQLNNLSQPGHGLVHGATRVDAYVINNEDLEDYINIREYGIAQVLKSLSDLGYVGQRAYRGSQDGEAILYHKPYQEEIHFLCHCDPIFVQDIKEHINNITQYVKEMMNL